LAPEAEIFTARGIRPDDINRGFVFLRNAEASEGGKSSRAW
jgi:hypothetical protein